MNNSGYFSEIISEFRYGHDLGHISHLARVLCKYYHNYDNKASNRRHYVFMDRVASLGDGLHLPAGIVFFLLRYAVFGAVPSSFIVTGYLPDHGGDSETL